MAMLGLARCICLLKVTGMRTIPVEEQGALQRQAVLQGGRYVRQHWSPHPTDSALKHGKFNNQPSADSQENKAIRSPCYDRTCDRLFTSITFYLMFGCKSEA